MGVAQPWSKFLAAFSVVLLVAGSSTRSKRKSTAKVWKPAAVSRSESMGVCALSPEKVSKSFGVEELPWKSRTIGFRVSSLTLAGNGYSLAEQLKPAMDAAEYDRALVL